MPGHPATHPSMTVVSKEVRLMTSSRLLQDYFKTIFRLIQVKYPYCQAQPQLNSISTQSTELGTTQLKLVLSIKSG